MQLKPRLFIGGHREIRRPENVVDEALMQRLEDVRSRLRLKGKDVKPLREPIRGEQQLMSQRQRRRVLERQLGYRTADASH